MDGAQAFLYLACIGSPMTLAILWTETNSKSKWRQMFSLFKALLLALPFMFFPINGPVMYQEYQLTKHKKFTSGIVTNIFSKYNARGATTSYWADINYYYGGQVIRGLCGMKPDQYQVGDSVIIAYSSEIPEFYELAGKKN
jgi:hypothetical protein